MRIVQDMAGYTLGQADMVRRMMGKKKLEAMQKEKTVFLFGKPAENGRPAIDGAIKRGVSQPVAEKIWNEMESFASYAFNKSHAAAYSVITYETAYLKTFYKPYFLTSVLNNRISNSDEIKNYVTYAKSEGLEILPPNINKSSARFTVENGNLRFGLAALKNVGIGVIEMIVDERDKNGEYKDILDFAKRVPQQALNKRCLESLILSGAFDCFLVYRSKLMQVYDNVVQRVAKDKKNKATGQFSLFDSMIEETGGMDKVEYPSIPEFNSESRLKFEKEVSGIYISGHPLDQFMDKFNSFNLTSDMLLTNESDEDDGNFVDEDERNAMAGDVAADNLTNNMPVTCGGIVSEIKKLTTKNGNKEMAFVKIEDIYGIIEVMFFPNVYARYKQILTEDLFVTIKGKLSIRDSESPSVLCETMTIWEKDKE
ncbi:MAG: OB-fold nucleic acid binding domain-containing protein, partial [Clostridia bacterium]